MSRKESAARYYAANRQKWGRTYYIAHRDHIRERVENRRLERQAWVDETKSFLGCFVCGEDKPWRLHWHHLSSKDSKRSAIAFLSAGSLAKLLESMSHCVVLCANCHADYHHYERERD